MMTEYILQSFRERVSAMSWLSELSKQRTVEKVEAITLQAAYPLQIFDNDYVNGLYSTVSKDQWYSYSQYYRLSPTSPFP